MKTKIVIYVDGGTVQSVHSNLEEEKIDVVLVDADNLTEEGRNAENVLKRETRELNEVF